MWTKPVHNHVEQLLFSNILFITASQETKSTNRSQITYLRETVR